MRKFSIHKPFEVLQGLRDGELKHIIQLTTRSSPHSVLDYATHLERNGLLTIDNQTGGIIANKAIFEIFSHLAISLGKLKEYDNVFSVITNPIFNAKDSIIKNKQEGKMVFVIMPFFVTLLPIFEAHIKPVVNNLGYKCHRGDDLFTTNSVVEDIWQSIMQSSFIIANCTGRNPNVFYEIGIAHALGKETILLAESIEDIPFDLRHRRVVIYSSNTTKELEQLDESLKKTIKSVSKKRTEDREYSYDRFNIDFPVK